MKKKDYHTSFKVNAPAGEVFNSINLVSKWWTADLKGSTQKAGDIFTVRFGQTFITMKITESVPGKKITWLVIDCNKHWLKNKKEWIDTKLAWEISTNNNATQVDFTHLGLVPGLECYDACENAWTGYLHSSLLNLVTSGKGQADKKKN